MDSLHLVAGAGMEARVAGIKAAAGAEGSPVTEAPAQVSCHGIGGSSFLNGGAGGHHTQIGFGASGGFGGGGGSGSTLDGMGPGGGGGGGGYVGGNGGSAMSGGAGATSFSTGSVTLVANTSVLDKDGNPSGLVVITPLFSGPPGQPGTAVPEPTSLALTSAALVLALASLRRWRPT